MCVKRERERGGGDKERLSKSMCSALQWNKILPSLNGKKLKLNVWQSTLILCQTATNKSLYRKHGYCVTFYALQHWKLEFLTFKKDLIALQLLYKHTIFGQAWLSWLLARLKHRGLSIFFIFKLFFKIQCIIQVANSSQPPPPTFLAETLISSPPTSTSKAQ